MSRLCAAAYTPKKEICGKWREVKLRVKTESVRKLSNLNFQWTKTLYQNNLKHIAFFFYIFQGLKM